MSGTVQAGNDTPRVLYVPGSILQAFEFTNTAISELLNFETLRDLLGQKGLANFVFFNSLYNSQSDIFLPSELITGIDCVDLYELLYRKAVLQDHSHSEILNVKKDLDALVANNTKPTREDLIATTNTDVDTHGAERYYVPKLFVIGDNIYGVRLEAITGDADFKTELRNVTVANLGILSVRYEVQQWVKTDLFKEYVELC